MNRKRTTFLAAWNRLPSASWLKALDTIHQASEEAATLNDLPMVIERSGGSEARYFHVHRDGTWFGFRVAAHLPCYACSRDYFQLLLEDPPDDGMRDYLSRQAISQIVAGMSVVADPHEVYSAIRRKDSDTMTTRQIAQLRHQMNQRAKWAWEYESACSRGPGLPR
ncbi:MAG: hypothetical protein AAGA03_15305 [Planctomycetota bacterium]